MNKGKRTGAGGIALGGLLAAMAVVVMGLGGLIPVATYVCPIICTMFLAVFRKVCGNRLAWAWYAAVGILSALFSPDKEAVAVYVFLGYYPILKPVFDTFPLRWLWKALFFNGSILIVYWLLLHLMGMTQLSEDFRELGIAGLVLMMVMGNFIFFLLDRLLGGRFRR